MKLTKSQRNKIIEDQHGCCALCRKHLSITDQVCYDEAKGKVICRRCVLLVNVLRAAGQNGLQINDLIEYEAGGTPA